MRKRVIERAEAANDWMDLERIATVEVTSEDPSFPIEQAFDPAAGKGWKAAEGGEQEIRVVFDAPVSLHRIQLQFKDSGVERTQEFVLRYLSGDGNAPKELFRQQWNFSAGGSTNEVEDYSVSLNDVAALELTIRPDLRDRNVVATLASFRLA